MFASYNKQRFKKVLANGFTFLCLLSYSSTSLAQQSTEADAGALIALYGDSISVGFQIGVPGPLNGNGNTNLGCPDIYLGHMLRNETERQAGQECPTANLNSPVLDANARSREIRDAVVVNWGVTSSDSSNGVSRVVANLTQSRNQFPDATRRFSLINYGTNDINNGIGTSTTRFNLQEIVRLTRSRAGFQPIITTILPRSDASNVIDSRVFTINDQIRQLAAADPQLVMVDLFAEFVNFPGGWPQLMRLETTNSGNRLRIHPTDQGYLFLAERWFDLFLRDAVPVTGSLSADTVLVPVINLLLNED